jgi:hypothetical protein
VVILRLDVVHHSVKFGPLEASVEEASLGGILSNGAVAFGSNLRTIGAALGAEDGIVLDVLHECDHIGEAVAAGAAKGEGASSHCYFIVFN